MSDYVRVRDAAAGYEYTLLAHLVQEGHEVLDKPALGRDGFPRPPKYRVPLGDPRVEQSRMDAPQIPVTKKTATPRTPTTAVSADQNKEH